jgi:general secretion pathway protein F
MAAFEYQAIDGDGKTQTGLIEADTARQARQQLRGMSLMPLEIGEVTSRESSGVGKARRDKLNVATLSLITRQLATLISEPTSRRPSTCCLRCARACSRALRCRRR